MEIVNDHKLLTIFSKSSIVDNEQGLKFNSDNDKV